MTWIVSKSRLSTFARSLALCLLAAGNAAAQQDAVSIEEYPRYDNVVLVHFSEENVAIVIDPHRIQPLDLWRSWWGEMERCLGLMGDFNEVRWFTARRVWLNGAELDGLTMMPPLEIVLTMGTVRTVKHEMGHAIQAQLMDEETAERDVQRCARQ